MGCNKTKRGRTRGKIGCVVGIACVTVFAVIFLCFGNQMLPGVKGSGYIPAAPTGPTRGYVSMEYCYEVVTMNTNASWMFDWGDGTMTPWLELGQSNVSIMQTHQWAAEGDYQVRVIYKNVMYPGGVYSDPLIVSIKNPDITDYPSTPRLMTGTVTGIVGSAYTYSLQSTDPYRYQVQCRCDWGDGTTSGFTPLTVSSGIVTLTHHWDSPGEYYMRFQASNEYGLASDWSSSIHVTMQNATAVDLSFLDFIVINGVTDTMTYQLDHTGTFYNATSGRSTVVHWDGKGMYYIDDNGDKSWDYEYTPSLGQLHPIQRDTSQSKQSTVEIPWFWIIILGVIGGVILTVAVLYKAGYIYVYEEIVEKK